MLGMPLSLSGMLWTRQIYVLVKQKADWLVASEHDVEVQSI